MFIYQEISLFNNLLRKKNLKMRKTTAHQNNEDFRGKRLIKSHHV